jgi:hypothetical protein
MELDELRGLPREEAIKKVAAFAGISPETVYGHWRVESDSGQHPTMINPKSTAKGHMQFIDKTAATWEQRLGKKFDRFDFTDSMFMFGHQMKENMQIAGGDERTASGIFYTGDKAKVGDPDAQEYVAKVHGGGSSAPRATVRPGMDVTAADVRSSWQPPAPPAMPEVPRIDLPTPAGPTGDTSTLRKAIDLEANFVSDEARLRNDVPFLDKVAASLDQQQVGIKRTFDRLVGNYEQPSPDVGFVQDYAANFATYEKGYSEDERDWLRESKSKPEYDDIVRQITDRRSAQKIIGSTGFYSAMGASLVGGVLDVQNYAVGWGTAKALGLAGVGMVAATRAGQGVRAAVYGGVEQVAGNVAYEGLQDVMGQYKSLNDYGIAAVTSLPFAAMFSVPAYRGAQRALMETARENVIQAAVAREADLFTRAKANLGPDASPDALRAEADRIQTQDVHDHASRSLVGPTDADTIPAHIDEEELAKALKVPEGDMSVTPTLGEQAPSAEVAPLRLRVEQFDPALSKAAVVAAPDGVTLAPSVTGNAGFEHFASVMRPILDEFLPGHGVVLANTAAVPLPGGRTGRPAGVHLPASEERSLIAIQPADNAGDVISHELGHIVDKKWLAKVDPAIRQGVHDFIDDWTDLFHAPGQAARAMAMRGPVSKLRGMEFDEVLSLHDQLVDSMGPSYVAYYAQAKELIAEQFAKYINAGALGEGPAANLTLPQLFIKTALGLVTKLMGLFKRAKEEGLIRADTRMETFFEEVRKLARNDRMIAETLSGIEGADFAVPVGGFKGPQMTQPPAPRIVGADWELAKKYRLDLMPQTTALEKAEFKQALAIYRKAEEWNVNNPRDDERTKMMVTNSLFQGAASTGSLLALSDNPVARMVAGTLLENTTGAMGRRSTAAVAKDMHERVFMGNAINEYRGHFELWAQSNGASALKTKLDAFHGGEIYPAFNRMVALEIESRRVNKGGTGGHPSVRAAADAIEGAYERMRLAQVDTKTVGWARLPESSRGYMTHMLSREKVATLTPNEERAFVEHLTEQFRELEDFDPRFSGELARKYLDHARVNANGGHDIPANIHNPQAAEMVRGALEAMNMNREEVAAAMGRYSAGGASHTKRRLQLDLTKEYPGADGESIKLVDIFETDQLQLLRGYSRRVSGEVSLAQFGVMGAQGMKLLRRSLEFGDHGSKVQRTRVLEAFDQTAAEFLGQPFGTSGGKWLDRAMTANSVARLGGMVFNQIGETVNFAAHLGAGHALAGIASMPRMRAELIALSKGGKVDGVLSSMELSAGHFGADGYKMVMPFDEPNSAYRSYGHDNVTMLDRGLRGLSHIQGVATGWRMLHAAQTRAAAEQITLKSLRFIRDGIESKTLADMGITSDVAAAMRADLSKMATFDGAGRVLTFDITKASDPKVAAAYTQAVLRGSRQIIQGTFVGETGKWAHDGLLKVFAQFRTFGLTSMEKQWARSRANHGVAGTLGIMLGAMSAVIPVYYARVALASIGRPDREEYIEQRMQPGALARALLNYIPQAGLAGDVLDGVSAIGGGAYKGLTGEQLPTWAQSTGGRANQPQDFVGGVIAPAAGYANDIYNVLQNPTDPHQAMKLLPGSTAWPLVPAMNMLRQD